MELIEYIKAFPFVFNETRNARSIQGKVEKNFFFCLASNTTVAFLVLAFLSLVVSLPKRGKLKALRNNETSTPFHH